MLFLSHPLLLPSSKRNQQLLITALENREPATSTTSPVRALSVAAFRLLHSEAAALHRVQERIVLAENLMFLPGASPQLVQMGRDILGRACRDLADIGGGTANHHILALWPRLHLSLLNLRHLLPKRDVSSLFGLQKARAGAEAVRRMVGAVAAMTANVSSFALVAGTTQHDGAAHQSASLDAAQKGGAALGVVHSLSLGGDRRTLEDVKACMTLILSRVVESLGSTIADLERFHAARVQDRWVGLGAEEDSMSRAACHVQHAV